LEVAGVKPAALLVLFVAIVSEVVGTAGLKASEGFSRVVADFVVVVAYGAAFYFLSLSLQQIPLGVAYAIWSGLGTVGAVLVGVMVWQESLGPARLIGIGLIVIGVVMLNVFAEGSGT
jgi:multidrug transporter EmrE-like cation transporter